MAVADAHRVQPGRPCGGHCLLRVAHGGAGQIGEHESVLAMTGGGVGRVGDWQRLLWAVADAVQAHAQLSGNEA